MEKCVNIKILNCLKGVFKRYYKLKYFEKKKNINVFISF